MRWVFWPPGRRSAQPFPRRDWLSSDLWHPDSRFFISSMCFWYTFQGSYDFGFGGTVAEKLVFGNYQILQVYQFFVMYRRFWNYSKNLQLEFKNLNLARAFLFPWWVSPRKRFPVEIRLLGKVLLIFVMKTGRITRIQPIPIKLQRFSPNFHENWVFLGENRKKVQEVPNVTK